MDNICIPPEWKQAAEKIKYNTKICIVLGRTDSGKSTLCKFLVHHWTSSGIRVGYVDSDLGQSTIGQPATVAVKIFSNPPKPDEYLHFTSFHFVGNTSPEGFLLQTLHAIKLTVEKSHQYGAEITLVDTTGFVDGPVARILKLYKIEMLKPQWIIALQKKEEIEHLLKGYEKMGREVIRLACSKMVVTRSQVERLDYRNQKYKDYFKEAKPVVCSIHKVAFPFCILGTGQRVFPHELPEKIQGKIAINYPYLEKCGSELLIIADRPDEELPFCELKKIFGVTSVVFIDKSEIKNLLVGLNDDNNNTLGLGVIVDLNPQSNKLTLFTPVLNTDGIGEVHLGAIKIVEGKREGGRLRVLQYL
ncbi:MAG: Clp1/GlmU family protein [Candidatus Loosdrechtia sp.]|uniref:Clp1/GlmU family protein n=1 Tax=Candidatus Loosdrechtia sp. TaxID=3101272 RepID=UPI003A6BC62F|nr:MAG: Clp1/GlmU family protein [Candidatus Jettenia sp. AMX2]